jgi:hypothetical protein
MAGFYSARFGRIAGDPSYCANLADVISTGQPLPAA